MQYLVIILLLPAAYISYLTFRWLYTRERNKNKRVHYTKKALWLLCVSIILIYAATSFAFSSIQESLSGFFWLNAIIYALSLAIISGYFYMVVKGTHSRKNITKLLVILLSLALYIPVGWWGYQVMSVGVYGSKLGVTKKLAIKLTDDYIGNKINHAFKSAKKEKNFWLVTETLYTLDSKAEIDVDYKVDLNGGAVHNAHSDKEIQLKVARKSGEADGVEMMLFVDDSNDPSKPNWKSLQYTNTANDGTAKLSAIPGSSLKYYIQMRDCSFSCQNYYFKLAAPVKESYDILLDGAESEPKEI